MTTPPEQPRNPLHGVTLERILSDLVEHVGWAAMGERVRIRCFTEDPSIASSLRFLRRTPWAREKVERMYVRLQRDLARAASRAGRALPPDTADSPEPPAD